MLIFGGVYSNLQALDAVMQLAQAQDIAPQNCICTGDIIGYCGQPRESLERMMRWGAYSILGNVEIQLRDDEEDCGCDFSAGSRCDGFSEVWYAFAKATLGASRPLGEQSGKATLGASRPAREGKAQQYLDTQYEAYFHQLPDHIQFTYAGKSIGVVHGSTENVSEFIFASSSWEAKQPSFEALGVEVILAGHCGLPFADKKNGMYWLNPGVIGMPANDGSTQTWAMILDDANGFSYEFIRVPYDYLTAMEQMKKHHLPMEYAKTLETGIWDNMEILPDEERQHFTDLHAVKGEN
ncbi:metallophosphoesterase family protein [Nonlabens xiamenensis]|uniref:metallophosphoesterase family protein n=1 Tax=Nonlabens xiamenensis TaxID=2341043 RepID=UPI002938E3C8|nr:metallophosphoesterase family protein [Nonlabens xiamenensis]